MYKYILCFFFQSIFLYIQRGSYSIYICGIYCYCFVTLFQLICFHVIRSRKIVKIFLTFILEYN